jgi:PPOX class probable F420-dependent enzyme
MQLDTALAYVRDHTQGVVTTLRRDGRPQLSNITYWAGDDGVIRISVTDGRAKTNNLRRDPRASLHVTSSNFWTYCVLDCDVELMPTSADPNDRTVDALVEYYRTLSGEHPDWDEYRRAMVTDRRLMLLLTPTHAYGMLSR